MGGENRGDILSQGLPDFLDCQRPYQGRQGRSHPCQIHNFERIHGQRPCFFGHFGIQQQFEKRIDEYFDGHETSCPNVSPQRVRVLPGLGKDDLCVLDCGTIEKLAEGYHTGFLEERHSLHPREVQDFEDHFSGVANLQCSDDANQAVQPASQSRSAQIGFAECVVCVDPGNPIISHEQSEAGFEPVLVILRGGDHPFPHFADENRRVVRGIRPEEILDFLQDLRRGVLLENLGKHYRKQGVGFLDALQGYVLLLELGEDRLEVGCRGEEKLVQQQGGFLLHFLHDFPEEISG